MKTPALNTKIISTIPVVLSSTLGSVVIWYGGWEKYFAPLMLGIIAGGLVDLDNGLTGKFKNVVYAIVAFAICSLSVQLTFNQPILLTLVFTTIAFVFTMFGAAGTRYRTVSFGTLAVSVYTTLTHNPYEPIYTNTLLIILGTLLYSGFTLLTHLAFPHRPVQESTANAYAALADYLDTKALFFDPDETEHLEQHQIQLAMTNSRVINAFNQCRSALFYRMRGQHRHPRTAQMLRYYFVAQDIHERISSSHMHYATFIGYMQHTDLIYRIQRMIHLQAEACRQFAQTLRSNNEYHYSPILDRATKGALRALDYYAQHNTQSEVSLYSVQRLLDNISRISSQFANLGDTSSRRLLHHTEKTRIQPKEHYNFKAALKLFRNQSNISSPVFRHSIRMAVIACVCCIMVQLISKFHLDDSDLSLGYWILLTAVFVCQPNYSATKSRLIHRVIGTIAGVLVGSILPMFTLSLIDEIVIAVITVSLFFFLRTNKYSYSTFFITIQAMMGFAVMGFDVTGFFIPRIIDTVVGALVAGAAVYFLWPDWKYISLEKNSADAIKSNADYLKAVLAELQCGITDDVTYRVARRDSHDKAAALSSVLSDMSGEPEKHGAKLDDGFTLLKINYSFISYISALGAYRDKVEIANDEEQAFWSAFYAAANQIVVILQNMAQWDEKVFQAAWHELNKLMNQLQSLTETNYHDITQNQVLYRQLLMMSELLPTCYETLHRQHMVSELQPEFQAA